MSLEKGELFGRASEVQIQCFYIAKQGGRDWRYVWFRSGFSGVSRVKLSMVQNGLPYPKSGKSEIAAEILQSWFHYRALQINFRVQGASARILYLIGGTRRNSLVSRTRALGSTFRSAWPRLWWKRRGKQRSSGAGVKNVGTPENPQLRPNTTSSTS